MWLLYLLYIQYDCNSAGCSDNNYLLFISGRLNVADMDDIKSRHSDSFDAAKAAFEELCAMVDNFEVSYMRLSFPEAIVKKARWLQQQQCCNEKWKLGIYKVPTQVQRETLKINFLQYSSPPFHA